MQFSVKTAYEHIYNRLTNYFFYNLTITNVATVRNFEVF